MPTRKIGSLPTLQQVLNVAPVLDFCVEEEKGVTGELETHAFSFAHRSSRFAQFLGLERAGQ